MSNETQKLFDAPFAVMGDSKEHTKFNVIIYYRKSPRYCSTVASCIDQKTAIRFVRLPELYDALMDAAKTYCKGADFSCLKEHCAYARRQKCHALPWIELMQKVRDGK